MRPSGIRSAGRRAEGQGRGRHRARGGADQPPYRGAPDRPVDPGQRAQPSSARKRVGRANPWPGGRGHTAEARSRRPVLPRSKDFKSTQAAERQKRTWCHRPRGRLKPLPAFLRVKPEPRARKIIHVDMDASYALSLLARVGASRPRPSTMSLMHSRPVPVGATPRGIRCGPSRTVTGASGSRRGAIRPSLGYCAEIHG